MITRSNTIPFPAPHRRATVTCDVEGCDERLAVSIAYEGTAMDAWWKAQDTGWINRSTDFRPLDLCPFHAAMPTYLQGQDR